MWFGYRICDMCLHCNLEVSVESAMCYPITGLQVNRPLGSVKRVKDEFKQSDLKNLEHIFRYILERGKSASLCHKDAYFYEKISFF